jgi:hypothetical protein
MAEAPKGVSQGPAVTPVFGFARLEEDEGVARLGVGGL